MAETYLLATRCPVYRRHDSRSGSRTELENLSGDAKGKGSIRSRTSAGGRRRLAAQHDSVIGDNVDAHGWILLVAPVVYRR